MHIEVSETSQNAMRMTLEERLEALAKAESPVVFRHEARRLLREHSDLIDRVIAIARLLGMNGVEKRRQGGGRLVSDLEQLSRALADSAYARSRTTSVVELFFPDK